MKVLLATSRYFPHRGGLETVVHEVAHHLKVESHPVEIVTNRYPRSLAGYEAIDGINVTRLMFLYPTLGQIQSLRFDLFAAGLVFFPLTMWQLWRYLRRFQPDVVNLHYLGSFSLFFLLASYFVKFKFVVSLHGGDVDAEPLKNAFNRWLFRAVVRRATCVTTCSRALLEQAIALETELKAKGIVIHNGVDAAQFQDTPPYDYERPYIAAVGQLAHHKGFDILIESFAAVADTYSNVDVLIAGSGKDQAKLEALIESLGMRERIKLIGRLDKSGVASLMRHSLFVAMPSRREPFGIVALEGMAAGKIVLATPVGGLPEFADTPGNRLVQPDVVEWKAALDDLLANGSYTSSDEHNQQVARDLRWEVVTQRYIDAYVAATH